jgi:hypothetical protein
MSCFTSIRKKARNVTRFWLIHLLISTAINTATSTVVNVTFCDRIQYIMEARNELLQAQAIKQDWGGTVI